MNQKKNKHFLIFIIEYDTIKWYKMINLIKYIDFILLLRITLNVERRSLWKNEYRKLFFVKRTEKIQRVFPQGTQTGNQ